MEREPLDKIAEQISGALETLTEHLRDAIAEVHDDLVGRGMEPSDDASHFNATVRRYTLESLKPAFPDLRDRNGNMSPIHLILGPHQVRMLHAADSSLPRAQTKARELYYSRNDQGILDFNVFPPDTMVAIDPSESVVEESALVLLWDSIGPDLTLLELYRPSLTTWPGERLTLFASVEMEEDLDEIRRDRDARVEGDESTGSDPE